MNHTTMNYLKKILVAMAILPLSSISIAENEGFKIEEVTVTARKRTENLQETPISISAFSADELEWRQLQTTADISDVIPNLMFEAGSPSSGSNSAAQIYIRGIGQTDFSAVTDPGVGVYIDGVYYARSNGLVLDFLEIEQIEVLRGPQGTLFGRNTIGGAVSITSKKPHDEFESSMKLEIGDDNKNYWTAHVNLSLSDDVNASFSANTRRRDGYVTRVFDGVKTGNDDTLSARASILWDVSDDIEAYFIADYTKIAENGPPIVSGGNNDLSIMPRIINLIEASCPTSSLAPISTNNNPNCVNLTSDIGKYKSGSTLTTFSDLDTWGVSAQFTWEVSDLLTIKSITAHRSLDTGNARDPDGTQFAVFHTLDFFEHEQFSQELQISGKSMEGSLDWLVGLYYFDEQSSDSNPIILPLGNLDSGGATDNESTAVFAQGTYHVSDQLSITLGIRTTEDTKRFTPDQFYTSESALVALGLAPPGQALTPIGPLPVGSLLLPKDEFESTFRDVNYHLDVAYQWTDDFMTYASYSTGFKTGGFDQRFVAPPIDSNGNPTNAPTGFRPEFANSFEIGFKGDFLSNQFRLNSSFFFTDYEDLQIIIRETFNPVTFNGGEADLWGFELEGVIVPSSDLLINIGVGYLNAEYKKLDSSVLTNNTPLTLDHKLVNSPEWSLNVGASYNIDVSAWGGTLTPRVDWSFHDDQENDAINSVEVHQDSYQVLNLAVVFESDDGHWVAMLAGRNVLDEEYLSGGNSSFQGGSGYIELTYNRPPEWSLSLEYNFY